MSRLWLVLLPALRRFPAAEQAQALRHAGDTALDLVELLGMAAGLVAVTALTRLALVDVDMATRFAVLLANFVVAVPLLALLLGPWHLRRLQRGLRAALLQRPGAA
jgi:hypothetical protein